MDEAPNIQNGSCDITTPLSDLCTKTEISMLTHHKDVIGDEKCKNLGGFGGLGSPKVISNIAIR